MSILADLESICTTIFDRWDGDMRSGKLLSALSGRLSPGYDPRVDRVRDALKAVDGPLEAYDAGLLGDGGGGDVEWWQDYIRAELGRAHEFYESQINGG